MSQSKRFFLTLIFALRHRTVPCLRIVAGILHKSKINFCIKKLIKKILKKRVKFDILYYEIIAYCVKVRQNAEGGKAAVSTGSDGTRQGKRRRGQAHSRYAG